MQSKATTKTFVESFPDFHASVIFSIFNEFIVSFIELSNLLNTERKTK